MKTVLRCSRVQCLRVSGPFVALGAGLLYGVCSRVASAQSNPPDTTNARPNAPPVTLSDTSAPPAASLSILPDDARLNAPVTVAIKSKALAACLPDIDSSGVVLRALPPMTQRRVTVFASGVSLRRLLPALADTLNLMWRASNASVPTPLSNQANAASPASAANLPAPDNAPMVCPADYTLLQSDEARKREQKLLAASEAWELWAHNARRDAMQGAVQDALNARSAPIHALNPFADLLAALEPAQIQQAAELSTQPLGVISPSSNRNLLQNLVGVQPFMDMTPAQQAGARSLLGRSEKIGSNGDTLATGAKNDEELRRSSVGFVALNGSISLTVVPPDGREVWMSQDSSLARHRVPELMTDDGSDPEINALTRNLSLLDLSGAPDALRRKRVRFPESLDHASLPDLLQSLAQQTGLAIVADDFVRRRRTEYFWLLTDKTEYTLDEACGQMSKAFSHRMIYKDGVLRVQSAAIGPDLRAEPPAPVLARLRDMTANHLSVTLDDYALLGGMTRAQLDTLVLARFPGVGHGMMLINAQWAYNVLHFYALLPPELREQATSAAGLPLSALNARQTEAFAALSQLGARHVVTGRDTTRPTGLYIRAEKSRPSTARARQCDGHLKSCQAGKQAA